MSEDHLGGIRRFQRELKEELADFDKNLADARIISRDVIYKIILLFFLRKPPIFDIIIDMLNRGKTLKSINEKVGFNDMLKTSSCLTRETVEKSILLTKAPPVYKLRSSLYTA